MSAEFQPGQQLRVVSEPAMHDKRKSPWKAGDTVTFHSFSPSGRCVRIVGVFGLFRIERFTPA